MINLSARDVSAVEGKKSKHNISILKYREFFLLFFLLLLCFVIFLRNSSFLSGSMITMILQDTSVLIMLSIGMLMVIVTGGIDLSIAANMALTGMTVALIISEKNFELDPILALLIGLGLGFVMGAVNGLIISYGGVLPFMATLGTMNIYRGVTFILCDGEWVTSDQLSASFKNIGTSSFLGVNTLLWFAIIVFAIFYYVLNYTRTGRRIYAVGSNPPAARLSGINSKRILFMVYTVQGTIAGLCGVLWASRYAIAQGESCMGYEMYVIAACVLGGVNIMGGSGKIQGVVLGALIIGVINNALPMLMISSFWKTAMQGAIILLAVVANVFIMRGLKKRNQALKGGGV
jgi:rhamnose transport system permease protein